MPRMLLLGTKFDQPDIVEVAARLGIEVVLAQPLARLTAADLGRGEAVLGLDYAQPPFAEVARALHAHRPFDAVVSLTEPGLIPAAQLNDALGLRGTPARTANLLKDKAAMRARLDEAGFGPVGWEACADEAAVRRAVERLGYPCIVKPVDGVSSIGIVRLDGPGELEPGLARLRELGIRATIVEEYLDGEEVSVEAFSFAGRHVVVAVTEKILGANFVELGHVVPGRLGRERTAAAAEAAAGFLSAIGLADGPSHTELKLTSRGPRIIESHNRIGGDGIALLVRAACGIDLVELTFAWATGLCAPLEWRPEPVGGAAILFSTAAPGRIEAIDGFERAAAAPGVLAAAPYQRVGDVVGALRSSYDRTGFVAARAADADAAVGLASELVAGLRFTTVPDPGAS